MFIFGNIMTQGDTTACLQFQVRTFMLSHSPSSDTSFFNNYCGIPLEDDESNCGVHSFRNNLF